MDKLKMQTKNKVDINIETIGNLFPNTLTETIRGYDIEGNEIIEKAIDFEVLKQELSKIIVDGKEERYQMNWPGKKEAILRANAPTNMTLRPCKEESVNFDTTENLYIEGDNLEVLKLLRETYLNKVKMIYIDPPYNTGNDTFVYDDGFAMSPEEFEKLSNKYDEDGNIQFDIKKNNESNGRIHTDWLNMMYPRLKLAKDLLSEDGVIFISIDDKEYDNLKKICNEVLGEKNLISTIIWEKAHTRKNSSRYFSSSHEYILCYARIKKNDINDIGWERNLIPRDNNNAYKNPDNDPNGPWKLDPITAHNYYGADYKIYKPNGVVLERPRDRYWVYSEESWKKKIEDNAVIWGEGNSYPLVKRYLKDVQDGLVPVTLFNREFAGDTNIANKEIKELFKFGSIFDYTKPIKLITRLLQIGIDKNDIVLDFFSGSATTAHAIMQLNAEDGGNRKFIMVQLPEETDEKSEANKAGYKNICEIGKERIRRAGKKIIEENDDKSNNLDIGFRVLKLDSSNMKDVYYNPSDYDQNLLDKFESNIKEERSSEDLLFQVMLELGEMLSSDIAEMNVNGKKVFNVGDGNIIACFDDNITEEVITSIAKMTPYYAVFRDSSLANDSVAANLEQIFKTYSPNTIRKVL